MMTEEEIVPFSQGFTDNDDIFRRKDFYAQILRIIKKSPDSNPVLALDDNWGNGKTTFVQMMHSQLKIDEKESLNVIYFDSFENDYLTDPFISLTAQIYSMIEREDGTLEKFGKKFINASKKVGATILTGGMRIAISTATAGLIDSGTAGQISKAVIDKATDNAEAYVEKKIKSADEEKANITYFKNLLEEIHTDSNKKTVFIIDELDRARPDYALDLLEKIKHLFSVEGVIFLLVMNRNQFERSIEQRYGRIDSHTYLNKFVNYWFTLPKVRTQEATKNYNDTTIAKHLKHLNHKHKLLAGNGDFIKVLSFLLDINEGSLREAERCYSLLAVLDGSEKVASFVDTYQTPLAFIIFLKVTNPQLLNKFISKKINKDELYLVLNITSKYPIENQSFDILNFAIDYFYLSDEESKTQENIQLYGSTYNYFGRRQKPFEDFFKSLENLSLL
ncbi:KAP family P-loop NTPase fold protein [Pantoea sp. y20]